MRVIFAGTPDFAVPTLRALWGAADQGVDLVAVLTQPDRAAGRGRKLTASPIKKLAVEYGVPVEQAATLRASETQKMIAGFKPDLIVVVAYGLLLPPEVLSIPRLGCINVHASLLPRWRGAAPIQHALLAGDEKTGVAIMRMSEGLDEGPVYLSRETLIDARDTGSSLHDRLAELGALALLEALPGIVDGSNVPQSQDNEQANYASKISKADAHLDFTKDAAELERQVRAFNAWPVSWCRWATQSTTLRIWKARVLDEHSASTAPGTVTAANAEGIRIQCRNKTLVAQRLQLPGKNPVSAAEFCNAWTIGGDQLD